MLETLLMIQDHMPLCYDNEIQVFFVSPINFSFYDSRIGRIAVMPVPIELVCKHTTPTYCISSFGMMVYAL